MDFKDLLGGATKGLEYVAKVIKLEEDAIIHGKDQQGHDARVVMNQWADEVIHVVANPLMILVDPFSGSRHAAQALLAKYPK